MVTLATAVWSLYVRITVQTIQSPAQTRIIEVPPRVWDDDINSLQHSRSSPGDPVSLGTPAGRVIVAHGTAGALCCSSKASTAVGQAGQKAHRQVVKQEPSGPGYLRLELFSQFIRRSPARQHGRADMGRSLQEKLRVVCHTTHTMSANHDGEGTECRRMETPR